MSNMYRYPEPIPTRLFYLSIPDTQVILKIWERVGDRCFLHSDIADLLPNASHINRYYHREVLKKCGRMKGKDHHNATIWQIRSDVIDRLKVSDIERIRGIPV